jgi:cytochrome P450
MMIGIFIALGLGVFIIAVLSRKRKTTKHPSFVVKLPGYPLIGNVLSFFPDTILDTFLQLPLKYGRFVEFSIFGKHGIIVNDADIAREVLMKRPKIFRRTSMMNYLNQVLRMDLGLFAAEGQVWNRTRRATTTCFSNVNISHKYSALTDEMFSWMKRIHDYTITHPNQPLDMRQECFSVTIRVITIVAFGLQLDDPLCAYFLTDFQQDIVKLMRFMGESTLYPLPMWTWKYSPYYSFEVDAVEVDNRFSQHCLQVIEHKRTLYKEGKLPMNCMMDSFIANHELQNDKGLTEEEIIANVKTIYLAGAETTAVTLSWLFYYFAVNPSILSKVEKETKEVLLKSFTSLEEEKQPAFEETLEKLRTFLVSQIEMPPAATVTRDPHLPFAQAVIKESLRLGQPASFLAFESIVEEPVHLSNGIVLEKEEMVWINFDGIHRIPEIFEHPFEFQPERWLISDEAKLQEMESHYFPFGSGPRVCPGMSLAMNELYLAIAVLSLFFDLSLDCPKEEVKRISNFASVPNKVPILFQWKKCC